MSTSDEECNHTMVCLCCNKTIHEKPWMSVNCNEEVVHGCSYLCSKQFRELVGNNYWKNVINKEDFNEPRPIYGYTNRIAKRDITTGFGMDEIREEIEKENERIELIEMEFEASSSDDSEYDEDNY